MSNPHTLAEQIVQAFRDHGITTAIGVLVTSLVALAAAVVRRALSYDFPQLC